MGRLLGHRRHEAALQAVGAARDPLDEPGGLGGPHAGGRLLARGGQFPEPAWTVPPAQDRTAADPTRRPLSRSAAARRDSSTAATASERSTAHSTSSGTPDAAASPASATRSATANTAAPPSGSAARQRGNPGGPLLAALEPHADDRDRVAAGMQFTDSPLRRGFLWSTIVKAGRGADNQIDAIQPDRRGTVVGGHGEALDIKRAGQYRRIRAGRPGHRHAPARAPRRSPPSTPGPPESAEDRSIPIADGCHVIR